MCFGEWEDISCHIGGSVSVLSGLGLNAPSLLPEC